jgi:hypothetical protein
MRFLLRTLLSVVVLAPIASYLAGSSFGWFPFRPEVYALVAFTAGGGGFFVAGLHAILTKEIPLRGGGTMTGQSAVNSGRICAVIGGCLVVVGGVGLIVLSLR